MTTVADHDLGDRTAEVLRVADGTPVTITVDGTWVAKITALRGDRRVSLSRSDLINILRRHQADAGLRAELHGLVGEDTDDLGELR